MLQRIQQYTNYSITQRDRPMVGAFIDTVELAWLDVLCVLAWLVTGLVEPGLGCVEWSRDEFAPASVSTGPSNGISDWLKNRGPIWRGSGTSLFDPNGTLNVGTG
jgi:hypothetical protein